MGGGKQKKTAEKPKTAEPNAAESTTALEEKQKGKKGGLHFLWVLLKYSIVSMIVALIQIILQYTLPLIFDSIQATLPHWLNILFNVNSLFDVTTASGKADYAKYVVNGIITWGYVLPFFLSNFIANTFGYFENRKRTFKSKAPQWHFTIYFVILTLVIIFSTWLQGVIYPWIMHFDNGFVATFGRLLVMAPSGLFQFIVLFIAQKLLLPEDKTKKPEEGEKAANAEKAETAADEDRKDEEGKES